MVMRGFISKILFLYIRTGSSQNVRNTDLASVGNYVFSFNVVQSKGVMQSPHSKVSDNPTDLTVGMSEEGILYRQARWKCGRWPVYHVEIIVESELCLQPLFRLTGQLSQGSQRNFGLLVYRNGDTFTPVARKTEFFLEELLSAYAHTPAAVAVVHPLSKASCWSTSLISLYNS